MTALLRQRAFEAVGKRAMKILICGGDGQLGSDCVTILQRKHEVVAVDIGELDITNLADVEDMIRSTTPFIILNCAAYTQVDACETQKELAWKVNVEGPRNLALSAKKYDSRLIHISTDYIFDGKKKVPEPYIEDDEPNPVSYYGLTKLESEQAIREITNHHIILRTAWMYGVQGHNFPKTMLKLALQDPRKEIKVVNDQFGSPTWSYRLAQQIEKLIEVNSQGTYHATSEGYCTWYELAGYFLQKMGVPRPLIPCTSEEYPTPAPRPQNSILENGRLKQEGMNVMTNWKSDLDQFVSMFKEPLIDGVTKVK